MTPFSFGAKNRGRAQVIRAGGTTTFALGLLALIATDSIVDAGVMLVASGTCVAVALSWVAHKERRSADVPEGALWAGRATVRVLDLLGCPLLDTVTVRRPTAAKRHPAMGALGDVVLDRDGLTWTATLAANFSGVRGSFSVPWSAVTKAQAASIPAATPGSGAIGLTFADGTKLDLALAGTYGGFRAALTRLSESLPGLGD